MKVALVNPPWSFEGSVYFGCREPHLPLEYGYTRALLERGGHDVRIVDAQLDGMDDGAVRNAVAGFSPDLTVVTTAPSYLFWRCAPPELRVPRRTVDAIRDVAGVVVVVGPHASTTPRTTLRKLGADVAVLGECEDVVARLAATPRGRWSEVPSIARASDGDAPVRGGLNATDLDLLPALRWGRDVVARHAHHHHRFDATPRGAGAEVEYSRGCPYHCTFCAKDNFRDKFRKRPLATVLDEIDGLIEGGVRYVYFIDEIFVPDRPLLEALALRPVAFGVQMRIDNWTKDLLELLGRAGCVSIETGIESLTEEGRSLLAKRCKLSTDELTELLITAKRHVPFVQANLLDAGTDTASEVRVFREKLARHGVWANDPVPMFPYPGSPGYTQLWGRPDDRAWERAHEHYLRAFEAFSDLQEARPLTLPELESASFDAERER